MHLCDMSNTDQDIKKILLYNNLQSLYAKKSGFKGELPFKGPAPDFFSHC